MEIKDFVRPTQIVRSVMRAHGKPSELVFTNSYKHCRTVKCYSRGSAIELIGDIRTALIKAGVNNFKIRTRADSAWRGPGVDSVIVRIPRSEQK